MSCESPEITIILPTFQRADKLALALENIRKQTFRNFVILVCDNASTDSTPDVIERARQLDSRIEYVRRPENIGAQANYVRSVELVRTPYLAFFADDDLLEPEFLVKTHSALETWPDAAFCAGFVQIERQGVPPQINPPHHPSGIFPPEDGYCRLLQRHITWTSILFRTAHVNQIGGLNQDTHPYVEVDLQLRLAMAHPYVFISEVFAHWDADNSSKTRRQYLPYFEAVLRMLVRYLESDVLNEKMRSATLKWGKRELGKWAKSSMNNNEASFDILGRRLHDEFRGRNLHGTKPELLLWMIELRLKIMSIKIALKRKLHFR